MSIACKTLCHCFSLFQNMIQVSSDRAQYNDLQSLLCATLQVEICAENSLLESLKESTQNTVKQLVPVVKGHGKVLNNWWYWSLSRVFWGRWPQRMPPVYRTRWWVPSYECSARLARREGYRRTLCWPCLPWWKVSETEIEPQCFGWINSSETE